MQIMRKDPSKARDEIRELTVSKLQEVDVRLQEMEHLKRELQLLVNLCTNNNDCGILNSLTSDASG